MALPSIDSHGFEEVDPRIVEDVLRCYKELEEAGKLASRQQLAGYYRTFRNKFGPEQLALLDGEALLKAMYIYSTKDSLIYWLEFKNDEELPGIFGGISGGSAYNYGLYYKSETEAWMSGTSHSHQEITVEEAIVQARQHRDELTRGCDLLARLPEHSDLADYEQLQLDLSRVAPSVYNTAWGHKYFSLLYPDKLDDFHNADYARYHLIKLLLTPPATEGRYVTAPYFLHLANTLQMPVNILTTVLNKRVVGKIDGYWRIGVARYDENSSNLQDDWFAMQEGNFCAIGAPEWLQVGDLSFVTNKEKQENKLLEMLRLIFPDRKAAVITKFRNQLFGFCRSIEIGDLVLAADGATIRGVGRVIDTYKYDPNARYPHQLPVEWLSLKPWKLEIKNGNFEGKLTSVYKIKQLDNLLNVGRRVLEGDKTILVPISHASAIEDKPPVPPKPLAALTGLMGRIQATLARKGQLILYGPPGTGKTYWAERTAHELAARSRFHRTFDDLSPEQRLTIAGDGKDRAGSVRICCFHPAYGYEDFLEGFRPDSAHGQMQFVPRDGIFKQLCLDAAREPGENFYLIIDEINRGDIPRIFGELLLVLEKDKRGKFILLPLTKQYFQVPPNVFLLGTMNTADRSIALLDTALRRRFGFIELLPDSTPLKHAEAGGIPLGPWLEALNSRICQYVGRDARNLQIGHAYLMEKGLPINDLTTFARVIQDDILPLLEEYCYEDYHRLEQIMGSGLIDVKLQQVRHDLFEAAQQSNLVQALLSPCPEILTSAQAIDIEEQQAALDDDEEVEGDEGDATSGDDGQEI